MYIPDHFNENHPERVAALIEGNPFGTLVTASDGRPCVSHLPFLYERHSGPHGKLSCHLARANPQWRQLAQGQTVLAVFQGPHAYVSPAWYAAPGVPTWNYAVAHLYGVVRVIEDAAGLAAIVELARFGEYDDLAGERVLDCLFAYCNRTSDEERATDAAHQLVLSGVEIGPRFDKMGSERMP